MDSRCGQFQLTVRIDFLPQSCPAGVGCSRRLADHSAGLGMGGPVCRPLLSASEPPPEILSLAWSTGTEGPPSFLSFFLPLGSAFPPCSPHWGQDSQRQLRRVSGAR